MSYKLLLFYTLISFYSVGLNALVDKETLEKIMAFDMEDITKYYRESNYKSYETAKKIEVELKKFLALRTENENLKMFSEEIDRLWHIFILHTKRYEQFCNQTTGSFLHHTLLSRLQQQERDLPSEKKEFIEQYKENFGKKPSRYIWTELKKTQSLSNQC